MFSIFLAFTFFCLGYSSADYGCPPNEFFNGCGSACTPTCQKPPAEYCTFNCVPGCYCVSNFIRDELSGMCVKSCP
ncbi:chymotrypsin inhibitor-like [Coccinella septempunctata]|uniref:chymotrypsin inhibitor-like n=1 Tax=Coccinella septempunctata TaxID=41139 RepID=UPI001D09645F|nr:chymotrypsin inhibitor-like [Coccinella septempunctata]